MKSIILLIFIFSTSIQATEYYVSPTGSDTAVGAEEKPWKTLAYAFRKLRAGDTLNLRAGRYHEQVSLNGLNGTAQKPITIRSYPGEKALIDGTMKITSPWRRHKKNIWKTKLDQDIWQLFVDDKNMTLARWPNSKIWSEEFWDQPKSWAKSEDVKKGYVDGQMLDADLKSIKVSLEGGLVVINSDRWRSRAGMITSHKPGTNQFEFTKVKDFRTRGSHYYFITALGLLDSEEEWFYDQPSKTLYLYSEKDPAQQVVRGRVIDASFSHLPAAKKPKRAKSIGSRLPSEHIVLDGLTFFASRVDVPKLKNLTIQNSDFLYSVASQRTLGSKSDANFNQFEGCDYLKLINNTFQYCDGKSLMANNIKNPVVENCLFHMVDFACLAGGSNSYTLQVEGGWNPVYRRNEINVAGASEGLRVSGRPEAPALLEYNYHTRCGLMQTDGASIQYPPSGSVNSINRFNWFINVTRTGFRFDGDPGGEWGIIYRNVAAFGSHRGFRIKGDCQEVYNNLAMDSADDLNISHNKGPKRHDGKSNMYSRVQNNAVQKNNLQKNLIVNPADKKPNWDGPNDGGKLCDELRDPANLDFRPKQGSGLIDKGVVIDKVSWFEKDAVTLEMGTEKKLDVSASYKGAAPDLGAYEFEDENYWIAGRIFSHASRPIPVEATTTAKTDADLIWLHGRDAKQHQIYQGLSENQLKLAGTQTNNIYIPKQNWRRGKTYYWRVDTVTHSGEVVAGPVWSFSCK